jgi:cytochrome bd ubiquinol oxidase subunit II
MDLNTTWFLLIGVLFIGYAILDGFDLGVGVLHLFARKSSDRKVYLKAIGPFWDGNEVWLLTGGGALFAAFPIVYATVFSGFYLALYLVLVALIMRAVAIEFRDKMLSPGWQRFWDWTFGIGSLLPAILFGVAVGNVLGGLPIDASGAYTGSFLDLLNPYAVLVGVLSLVMLTLHGALYLVWKTEGEVQAQVRRWVIGTWFVFLLIYLLATLSSIVHAGYLFENLAPNPLFYTLVLLLLVSIFLIPLLTRWEKPLAAFLASCVTIAAIMGVTALSLYPRLAPSSTGLSYSLTVYNASSSPLTLHTMLIIALIGVPLVLVYTIAMFVIFKGKVKGEKGY